VLSFLFLLSAYWQQTDEKTAQPHRRQPMKMKTLALIAASLFASTAFADSHAHWTYNGKSGAKYWGDMKEDFATCKLGKNQSPIDIPAAKAKKADLPAIGFAYSASTAEVVNNGHTIQVNLPAGSKITLAGAEYNLLQFHFHAPSEEKVNGKPYPLVAHFVHKGSSQNSENKAR
jgi:carbonic anhydrase